MSQESNKQTVNISSTQRGILISLVSSDFFTLGSARTRPEIEEILVKIATLIRNVDRFIRVEGHCSSMEADLLQNSQADSAKSNGERAYRRYLGSL